MAINGGSSAFAEDAHPIKPYHDLMRREGGGYTGSYRDDKGRRVNEYETVSHGAHGVGLTNNPKTKNIHHDIDPAYTSGNKRLAGKSFAKFQSNLSKADKISHESLSEE